MSANPMLSSVRKRPVTTGLPEKCATSFLPSSKRTGRIKQRRPRKGQNNKIEVALFWDQIDRLLTYLLQRNWRIFEPENGLLRKTTCSDDDFKRNSNIKHGNAFLRDGSGIPYLAPELVLLYKSIFVRYIDSNLPSDVDMVNCYRHDLDVACPLLSNTQKH